MAVVLVSLTLGKPGKNYEPVFKYFETFKSCRESDSLWLLDTITPISKIRDDLLPLVSNTDRIFAMRIGRDWAAANSPSAEWLSKSGRRF